MLVWFSTFVSKSVCLSSVNSMVMNDRLHIERNLEFVPRERNYAVSYGYDLHSRGNEHIEAINIMIKHQEYHP